MIPPAILTPRTAPEARLFWPEVREALEGIRDRFDEAWMPEDVWAEILCGNSHLWTGGAPGEIEAWVVLQVHVRNYDRSLHIWAAGENTEARAADYWPQIEEIARDNGCTKITMETPRRWEAQLPGARRRYLYEWDV